MLTLGALGGLSATFMGGSAAKKTQGPPINAQSPDEETFIKYAPGEINCSLIHKSRKRILTESREFLKNAEADEKKGNNVDATKKDAGR
jgi:F-type H+-transporting ATPase subunit k